MINVTENFITFCDDMIIAEESDIEIIDRNSFGIECRSNIKFNGMDISIVIFGKDAEDKIETNLQYLKESFPIMKKNFNKLFESSFMKWLIDSEGTKITKNNIKKEIKLYAIDFKYNEKADISTFTFIYDALPNTAAAEEFDAVSFEIEIKDSKIYKTDANIV